MVTCPEAGSEYLVLYRTCGKNSVIGSGTGSEIDLLIAVTVDCER